MRAISTYCLRRDRDKRMMSKKVHTNQFVTRVRVMHSVYAVLSYIPPVKVVH